MKNEIKILWDEVVYKWKFLSMVERSYEVNWEVQKYEMCVRNEVDKIIACLPVSKEWNFILIKEFRIPLNWYTIWVPAWLWDKPGEDPEEIVKREILEETWYEAWYIEHQFITPTSDWLTDELIDCYIATDCVKSPEWQALEWPEQIEVIEVPVEEIEDFILKQITSGVMIWSRMLALIEIYNKMKNNS